MTSISHIPSAGDATAAIDTDDGSTADDSLSSASQTTASDLTSQFPQFTRLPPELRHQIWRFAVPTPGINFFNVHCFPNDHDGCNRSTSPPKAYLDLRRLDIDDDDLDVSHYDPSSWQARYAVRQSCREARLICAIAESKAADIILTRPKRGLFVRAGDGQLRKTPLYSQDDGVGTSLTEPVVRRTVQVHVGDILCLSVENCSFNLPHEESPFFSVDDDDDGLTTRDTDDGWAYDPQLTPALPLAIPTNRLCASMARCGRAPLRITTDALFGLLYSHIPGYLESRPGELWPGRLLLMFDAVTQAVGDRDLEELTPTPEVVRDRFGDYYIRLPWKTEDFNAPDGFPIMYRLTKVWPETNDIRKSYLDSAILRSPKRPARPP